MTLGRLIELYQAEQQGKQIMLRSHYYGQSSSHTEISEVKLIECELKNLIFDEREDESHTYFIKGEEDEYGYKLYIPKE